MLFKESAKSGGKIACKIKTRILSMTERRVLPTKLGEFGTLNLQ